MQAHDRLADPTGPPDDPHDRLADPPSPPDDPQELTSDSPNLTCEPTQAMPPVVLTIAASDPLGGAGLQADLATFAAFKVHGTSAVTAVTAQSLRSLIASAPISVELVESQIRAVASSTGFEPVAVKTGLLRRREIVELVSTLIDENLLPAPVVDPVLVNGRGDRLVAPEVESAYRRCLFPRATVLTPNRAEAELLVGAELPDADAVLRHGDLFRALGAQAVVVTGGRFAGPPDDVVIAADHQWVMPGQRVDTANVRGSGCTFSAALASGLAHGRDLQTAVRDASQFVRSAIRASANWPAEGAGPVSHMLPF